MDSMKAVAIINTAVIPMTGNKHHHKYELFQTQRQLATFVSFKRCFLISNLTSLKKQC